jgi:hypothetical protein
VVDEEKGGIAPKACSAVGSAAGLKQPLSLQQQYHTVLQYHFDTGSASLRPLPTLNDMFIYMNFGTYFQILTTSGPLSSSSTPTALKSWRCLLLLLQLQCFGY